MSPQIFIFESKLEISKICFVISIISLLHNIVLEITHELQNMIKHLGGMIKMQQFNKHNMNDFMIFILGKQQYEVF